MWWLWQVSGTAFHLYVEECKREKNEKTNFISDHIRFRESFDFTAFAQKVSEERYKFVSE